MFRNGYQAGSTQIADAIKYVRVAASPDLAKIITVRPAQGFYRVAKVENYLVGVTEVGVCWLRANHADLDAPLVVVAEIVAVAVRSAHRVKITAFPVGFRRVHTPTPIGMVPVAVQHYQHIIVVVIEDIAEFPDSLILRLFRRAENGKAYIDMLPAIKRRLDAVERLLG